MGEAFMEKYGHFRGIKLTEAMPILERIAADNFDDWTWGRNMQCKYIDVKIDTRDGGWVHFRDRDDNLLSLAEIGQQEGKTSVSAQNQEQDK